MKRMSDLEFEALKLEIGIRKDLLDKLKQCRINVRKTAWLAKAKGLSHKQHLDLQYKNVKTALTIVHILEHLKVKAKVE